MGLTTCLAIFEIFDYFEMECEMTSVISFARIRDGSKIYGWLFDLSKPEASKTVRISSAEGLSAKVTADRLLPEWAKNMILASNKGAVSADQLKGVAGYFEYVIGTHELGGYFQVDVCDADTGHPLEGTPVVAYLEEQLEAPKGDRPKYLGIADDSLEYLRFKEFKKQIIADRLAGKQVIVHPPFISWNIPLFQRPQHMALAFSKVGAISVYFTNNIADNVDEVVANGKGFYIVSPEYFDAFLEAVDGVNVVLYSTCPQQIISRVTETGNYIIYEYVDHIDPKISSGWVGECLSNLDALSDSTTKGVVATAKLLHEEMLERFDSRRVALIPNGVSCDHFMVQRNQANIAPAYRKILSRGRSIVGYYGAIAPWLDYALIAKMADQLPEIDFVFIGPLYLMDKGGLPVRENIFWYGQVDYADLAHYAVWFDCCLIPFERGQIAATTSPLKLFEYFSLGKPVVVTSAMLECTAFPIVRSGETPEQVATSIEKALSGWGAEDADRSRALAKEHDWLRRAERYVEFLASLESLAVREPVEIPCDEIFFAPQSRSVLSGAFGYEVFEDEVVLIPNNLRLKAGGSCSWRLRIPSLPVEFAGKESVLSFDFKVSFNSNAEIAECIFDLGEERIRFAPSNIATYKTIRLRRMAGCDELVFSLLSKSDIVVHQATALFKLSKLGALPAGEAVYSNFGPLIVDAVQEKYPPAKVTSVFPKTNVLVCGNNVLQGTAGAQEGMAVASRPLEVSLDDVPIAGDNVWLEIFPEVESDAAFVQLRLCSPHFNDRGLERIYYYVAVDEVVYYYEDVCAFSGLNAVTVPMPKNGLKIGVVATENVGNWRWGIGTKVQLFDIVEAPEGRVSATATKGVVHADGTRLSDFLGSLVRNTSPKY